MSTRHLLIERYIEFVDYYLGDRTNIPRASALLRNIPELLDIHIGELNAAIHLFSRLKNTGELESLELLKYAKYLATALGNQELPPWEEIARKLITTKPGDEPSELHRTFEEMDQFEFIDRWSPPLYPPLHLLGALFVGFYRTYTRVTRPALRRPGVAVASSLEEMLAVLALNGCRTLLFDAVRHFFLDPEEEFTQELAQRVAAL